MRANQIKSDDIASDSWTGERLYLDNNAQRQVDRVEYKIFEIRFVQKITEMTIITTMIVVFVVDIVIKLTFLTRNERHSRLVLGQFACMQIMQSNIRIFMCNQIVKIIIIRLFCCSYLFVGQQNTTKTNFIATKRETRSSN